MTAPSSNEPNVTTRALKDLTQGLVDVPADIQVSDITLDSRSVSPGALFLACRGRSHHGLQFAEQAVARGARAVLYEDDDAASRHLPRWPSGLFAAPVPRLSRHAGMLADRFFGSPAQAVTVAGITGTNGKTTCAWLLAQALQGCGRPAAYMGTLGFGIPPAVTPTEHTTSDAVSVHRHLAALRAAGAECVSMEVSSHAIDQDRVAAMRFETAAFTNLTRDHLDYHGTMEAYGATKAKLFSWPTLAHRVINADDPFGAHLAAQLSTTRLVITTRSADFPAAAVNSLRHAEIVRAARAVPESSGLRIAIDSSWGKSELSVPLIGEFNVDNVLTVLAVLLAWGIPLAKAVNVLAQCKAPSGRMEVFGGTGSMPLAIVDYAHTPDGLEKALRAARGHCAGSLRVVFGCGGDRDAGKRPLMGRVAAELADDVIVTDDNPRTEDPAKIVADILGGIPKQIAQPARSGTRSPSVLVDHDRAHAIRTALERSAGGDAVLIAGKGHEDYQIYGQTRRPFSDQSVVGQALRGAAP
jgi:UDP-N-acetylmuramoyl-L-alanyl-D-glutamate--2,6-diaminopimelate ligase